MEDDIELPEDLELPEVEDLVWRDNAADIARDFFIVYGTIALIRDVARFMCNK